MFQSVLLLPQWAAILGFFIYGAVWGSFANVLIYRMQKEDQPPNLLKKSSCPNCGYNIPFYLNVPIVSWFILKGLCANCQKPFSFRYPLVEFLCAALFALLFWAVGWKWFLLEALLFGTAALIAGFIDWDQMILPDSLTLSGIVIGLLGAWLNPERAFAPALTGCLMGAGLLLFISWAYWLFRKQEGLGGGDIKLMAWIGALLSHSALLFIILSACFFGSIAGSVMVLYSKKKNQQSGGASKAFLKQFKKKDWQIPFAFGPYLIFSALLFLILREKAPQFLSAFGWF